MSPHTYQYPKVTPVVPPAPKPASSADTAAQRPQG
jgi:hypothetical protein